MLDVAVIDDPKAVEACMDPIRVRLLAALAMPGSASTLAAEMGLTRQKVNYHLKELERHGLVALVEERRRGNMTERVMQATAESFVVSPNALAALTPDPGKAPDQLSARWLVAVAARLVREVGDLIAAATRAGQRLATYGVDGEVTFASAADRAAFVGELQENVQSLIRRYHDDTAPNGRKHRLVVALHPSITKNLKED